MKTLFENSTIKLVINEVTNEIHIEAKKASNKTGELYQTVSLRIGVNSKGFDLTSNGTEYIPTSFNGLAGYRIIKRE